LFVEYLKFRHFIARTIRTLTCEDGVVKKEKKLRGKATKGEWI